MQPTQIANSWISSTFFSVALDCCKLLNDCIQSINGFLISNKKFVHCPVILFHNVVLREFWFLLIGTSMNNRSDVLKLTPFPCSFSVVHGKEQSSLKKRVGKYYRGELFQTPEWTRDSLIHLALAPLCGNRESALDNSPSMVPLIAIKQIWFPHVDSCHSHVHIKVGLFQRFKNHLMTCDMRIWTSKRSDKK